MKKNEYCKIVQDLLPNYLENLTSSETNDFIEKHIQNCKECENVLKDMDGDIKLEKINIDRTNNSLRKVKTRITIIIFTFIILSFILSYAIIYFFSNYRIYFDNNHLSIEKYTFTIKDNVNQKYVIIKLKQIEANGLDGFLYKTIVIALDDTETCINIRVKLEGLNHDYLDFIYNRINDEKNVIETDASIKNEALYYTYNLFNGKNISEIINSYNENEILEIEEY